MILEKSQFFVQEKIEKFHSPPSRFSLRELFNWSERKFMLTES